MSNQIETHVEIQLTNRNRATVFWRGILVAPVYIFLITLRGASVGNSSYFLIGFLIVLHPSALALIFRGKYPSYVLTINHAIMELGTRVFSYLFLLTDDYPSIERNPNIAVIFPDIEGGQKLNRWMPLVKWFLAIPLYIVGLFYLLITLVLTIYAWIVTSITGSYPAVAAKWVLGTVEYLNRVKGYATTLVTDEYPSFSM